MWPGSSICIFSPLYKWGQAAAAAAEAAGGIIGISMSMDGIDPGNAHSSNIGVQIGNAHSSNIHVNASD